jgi:hypothetical protein
VVWLELRFERRHRERVRPTEAGCQA